MARVLLALVPAWLAASPAFAWPTAQCAPGTFHVHGDIAAHALDDPAIAPLLGPLGLDRAACIAAARIEPQCNMDHHPGWSELADHRHMAWPLGDVTVGAILHVGGDSGVGCNHCPACEVCQDPDLPQAKETTFESVGELNAVPALASPYPGTYQQQVDAFHADQVQMTTEYLAYWASHSCPLPLACDVTPYVLRGMDNGQKLARAALLEYLSQFPLPGPDAGPDPPDAGPDASGPADATPPDAAPGPADATAASPDAAGLPADAGPGDAGPDAASAQAFVSDGGEGAGASGCGCRAGPGAALLALVAFSARERRRRDS